jgi:hypothetical protein
LKDQRLSPLEIARFAFYGVLGTWLQKELGNPWQALAVIACLAALIRASRWIWRSGKWVHPAQP